MRRDRNRRRYDMVRRQGHKEVEGFRDYKYRCKESNTDSSWGFFV
jgi:hypothetical protein